MAVALAHEHPPLGAMVAISDPTAPPTFHAPVDMHLGRYFYAGGYRFHVADDFRPRADRRVWQTAAATAVLLSREEVQAAAATPAVAVPITSFHPPPEPVGPVEPTEHW
jgi:hypothetical protein